MQVALALSILAASLAMGRGFLDLLEKASGYETKHIVTMNVSLAGTREDADAPRGCRYYHEVLNRLRAVPGVESAGGAEFPATGRPRHSSVARFILNLVMKYPLVITSSSYSRLLCRYGDENTV